MADHAASRDDPAYLRLVAVGPGPVRGRGARNLECWFSDRPIRDEYLIVHGGKLAGVGAHSYSAGNATGGSEEAARFKK